MVVLPHDPETYPAQSPDCISIHGESREADVIDSIAEAAQPEYHKLKHDLRTDEASRLHVDVAGELINGGNSVILATGHGDLIDIAEAHAGLYTELVRQGSKPRTAIMISKMISYLGFKLGEDFTPCTDLLKILEDEIFLSYPRTESTKKHLRDRLFPPKADRHNKELRKDVRGKLGEGGLLLAMAASGTTDKPINGDPSKILMGPLGHGTMEIMQADRTYVLPAGIWYQNGHTIFRTTDIPRRITEEAEAHRMMQSIAHTLTEATGDTEFIYNAPEVA